MYQRSLSSLDNDVLQVLNDHCISKISEEIVHDDAKHDRDMQQSLEMRPTRRGASLQKHRR